MLKQMRIAYAARLITLREREDAGEVLFDSIVSEVQALSWTLPGPRPQYQRIEISTLQQEWTRQLVEAARSRVYDNLLSPTLQ